MLVSCLFECYRRIIILVKKMKRRITTRNRSIYSGGVADFTLAPASLIKSLILNGATVPQPFVSTKSIKPHVVNESLKHEQ